MILPAHLTGRFQPLDVDFFNHLKYAHHQQLDDFQIGCGGQRVLKGMFYLWHQHAWVQMVTLRQIRSTHIHPPAPNVGPLTPNIFQILHVNSLAVQQGKLDTCVALKKMEKALAKALADKALLECKLKGFQAAEQIARATRGSKKRQRYPKSQLFDPSYQEEHAGELAGKPIIGFNDSNALPIIGHTSTGDNIYGTLHSETASQPGTGVFLQEASVDLDSVPLEPPLLEEKPLNFLAPVHDCRV
ncbi:hypothetical protein D1P53_001697 [Cryptococcus gattii VGV]|nr:hypothetical protein D1P53_001697 [Cryptococcus gattii VGV]